MATLYETFDPGTDNDDFACQSTSFWRAMTFTLGTVGANTAHKVSSVKLKGYRIGSPGTITVGIYAVDGSGHPTGSALASGTYDGNTLGTSSPGALFEVTITGSPTLSTSTKYAIVVHCDSGDGSNLIRLRDKTTGGYSGGNHEVSNDGGANWTSRGEDFVFYEYGVTTTDYTFALDQMSFTLTLQSLGLLRGYQFALDYLSYSLTLIAIGLSKGYTLALNYLSYSLTLISATITSARSLAMAVLNYSLTLEDIALTKQWLMTLAYLSYSLTLQTVTTTAQLVMTFAQLSYTLTLQTIGMTAQRLLVIATLTYTLTLKAVRGLLNGSTTFWVNKVKPSAMTLVNKAKPTVMTIVNKVKPSVSSWVNKPKP